MCNVFSHAAVTKRIPISVKKRISNVISLSKLNTFSKTKTGNVKNIPLHSCSTLLINSVYLIESSLISEQSTRSRTNYTLSRVMETLFIFYLHMGFFICFKTQTLGVSLWSTAPSHTDRLTASSLSPHLVYLTFVRAARWTSSEHEIWYTAIHSGGHLAALIRGSYLKMGS